MYETWDLGQVNEFIEEKEKNNLWKQWCYQEYKFFENKIYFV